MNPTSFITQPFRLAGLNFYGNPFRSSEVWTVENEIGNTWNRLFEFIQSDTCTNARVEHPSEVFFEIHILHPGSEKTGIYEIFVGFETDTRWLPIQMVSKQLEEQRYAVFTIRGGAIATDWQNDSVVPWLRENGYLEQVPYTLQRYDKRFKGMNRLEESELDILVPLLPAGKET